MDNMGFEIVSGETNRPYRVIGPVKARVGALFIFSKAPTVEEVNWKLQETARRLGANGVINVSYQRGVSATSWKALTARGVAVIFEPESNQ
jgi:hypothetical protein